LFIHSSVCLSQAQSKHPCPCTIRLLLPLPSLVCTCSLVRGCHGQTDGRDRARAGWISADHTLLPLLASASASASRYSKFGSIRLSARNRIGRAGTKCFLAALHHVNLCCVCIYCVASTDPLTSFRLTNSARRGILAAVAEDEDGKLLRRLLPGQQVKLSPMIVVV
jgi:hypothetical protein